MIDPKDLSLLTDVDELLHVNGAPPGAMARDDGAQPVEAFAEKRSTTDPLAVNFATVDLANGIDGVSSRVRVFAWVLLAIPPLLMWGLFVYSLISAPSPYGPGIVDTRPGAQLDDNLVKVFFSVITLPFALLWPYLLLRRRHK